MTSEDSDSMEEDIKDLPTLDLGIKYEEINFYLIFKNHPALCKLLFSIVDKSKDSKKMGKVLMASPLLRSLNNLQKNFLKSNFHFFQFQILRNSKIVEDLMKFGNLFKEGYKLEKVLKKNEEYNKMIIDVLTNVEKLMSFVIFRNYTENTQIQDDFDNIVNFLQKVKLSKFEFTENLKSIDQYKSSILLIESEIFQKEFTLQLAKMNFKNILRNMFQEDEESKSKKIQKESETLTFLLNLTSSSGELNELDKKDKLDLENFWRIMNQSFEQYKDILNSMSKKSKRVLPIEEINYLMKNVNKVKEVEIVMKSKLIKVSAIRKAFDNYFLITNLCNISQYLEVFLQKFEFNFKKELNVFKKITETANSKSSNFFEILNMSLKIDKKIIQFCKFDSVIYKFIENNITIWKGKESVREILMI